MPARRSPTPRGVDKSQAGTAKTAKERTARKRNTEGSPQRASRVGGRGTSPLAEVVNLDPIAHVRGLIRDIPDFPVPGILFKDITPLLADPKGFHIVLDALAHRFTGEHVDAIVGIESRGFIFGAALAARLNTSFVPVRKPGKLPYRTDKVAYSLEYGEAELEMHRDSLREDASVVIVDDLLATGGTAAAAAELVHRQGAYVSAFAFVIELDDLAGRERLLPHPVVSVLHY
ncbi:MAG: adenine phosphoribosyltransferase [Polyangiaceae bacterium]|nr:adenine phosphoribosyltransferase [Polyangiaceae bacterium]MCB9606332.1 adenine phosphoribosyltransferase [Polyangiaceae bacterium]